MNRSFVRLPADADSDAFEVYLNGVPQREGDDYYVLDGHIVFDRELRRDDISRRRWLLGAWGVGTYRQDDVVDVRYEVDGTPRVAHRLEIRIEPDDRL